MRRALALLALFAAFPAAAAEHGHGGPVVPVLLGLILILAAAKLGGDLFERLGQPAVLGELLFGIVLGNLSLVGYGGLGFLATDPGLEILAQLGVILLLFQVGLESDVKDMVAVGWSSLLVAVLGVIAPFLLGWGVSAWLLPEEETLAHLFIGATLSATSVGITARVLGDLGKLATREAKIILGAAVIDDVLGLVILSVVAGTITAANTGGSLDTVDTLLIVAKALVFLVGALFLGSWLAPRVFLVAGFLRVKGTLLALSLGICFLLAWLADRIGLATIVGAFAAGLILDRVSYKELGERTKHRIEELVSPLVSFLVPVFFVLMGVRVDLSTFGHVGVLGFAAVLSAAAILGKMVCAAGVLERGLDRVSVAVGMVPRGEVGLIFAGIGAQLLLHGHRVITPPVFAAVVVMVIVTTLITPPALKVSLARGARKGGKRGPSKPAAPAAPSAPARE
ncbi:MAG TPA: cation:proton antiporter [Thermoanaerobaculia bacterium]|nr:cation:proton antiporter [Thermoanaerobaculia bacterium]